ncbi:MAG: hypothetical protein WCH61_01135 [bacterium]
MAAFVALLVGAMLLYPDSAGHPGGYPFLHEFISALGMTKTPQGVPNLLPGILIMLIFAHHDYCGRGYKLGWYAAAAVLLLAEKGWRLPWFGTASGRHGPPTPPCKRST